MRANWSIRDEETADLVLSAPSARPMSQALDYPPSWETHAGDRGIHPIGEGLAYDVDQSVVSGGLGEDREELRDS